MAKPDKPLNQEQSPTHYDVLGLKSNATYEAIRASYKKLAVQYHPDKNQATDTNDQFQKITKAYEILSDEQKRKKYDAALEASIQQQIQCRIQSKKLGKNDTIIEIRPLVPIKNLVNEFKEFCKEKKAGKNAGYDYKIIPGNPTIHVFIFPNKESCNAFLKRLADKNMIDRSFSHSPIEEEPQSRGGMREQLQALRNELDSESPENENQPPSPSKR